MSRQVQDDEEYRLLFYSSNKEEWLRRIDKYRQHNQIHID